MEREQVAARLLTEKPQPVGLAAFGEEHPPQLEAEQESWEANSPSGQPCLCSFRQQFCA